MLNLFGHVTQNTIMHLIPTMPAKHSTKFVHTSLCVSQIQLTTSRFTSICRVIILIYFYLTQYTMLSMNFYSPRSYSSHLFSLVVLLALSSWLSHTSGPPHPLSPIPPLLGDWGRCVASSSKLEYVGSWVLERHGSSGISSISSLGTLII